MPRTGRPALPAVVRFERQVEAKENGCIEWTGHLDRYGYGQFRPGGRSTNHTGAHRWAYAHFVGPIPDGMHVDHLCRNRACVNPKHLEPVTPRENVMRSPVAPAAINAAKTHCMRGHELTPENTYGSDGKRSCKTCVLARSAANYEKRKQAI